MCFSKPTIPGGQPPAPTMTVADNLQLGTSAVVQRNAGAIGRQQLTTTGAGNRATASAGKPSVATILNIAGASATGDSSTPAGTLGLPPGVAASQTTPAPTYGGYLP